jgi:drug/metabolite transporter (DMT)-like permease
MVRFNMVPLGYGLLIAFLDTLMLTMVKQISLEKHRILRWMVFPTLVYAIHPWIFLKSLEYESLIVMNLLVDLSSDLMVTLIGFFYFHETIGPLKVIGVCLSFIAIVLMSLNDNDFESFWPWSR